MAALAGVVCLGLVGLLVGARVALLRSLPRASGEAAVPGLTGPVTVERDGLGIATVTGGTFEDVARGLGFVHAQERFFQMDLTRRAAAGELAELVGPSMLGMDRESRALRGRATARAWLESAPASHRSALAAYTAGVNAGLRDLRSRPPEYWALGALPAEWREEDSILVVLAMFRLLNYTDESERAAGVMRDTLPGPVADFLTPETSRYDAPVLVADEAAEREAMRPRPIPGPEVVDVRSAPAGEPTAREGAGAAELFAFAPGSNSWAVSGARSAHGGAMVAGDMHLGIATPNTWHRATLRWGAEGARRSASGATLPGAPALVVGTTDDVAWALTNVEADVRDLIVVETHPEDASRYRTPEGWEAFETVEETIRVRGRAPETLALRRTRWGPVTGEDHRGRPLVLKWTALEPGGVTLDLLEMLEARGVEEALDIAARWHGPAQNVLVADREGRIGWTISGMIPRRRGFDGTAPTSWADGSASWEGWLSPADKPRVVDPPGGALWTANSRTLGWPASRAIGTSWTSPVRADRIRRLLSADETFDEVEMLAIQLDERVESADFARDVLLEVVSPEDEDAALRGVRALAESWDGTAGAEQEAYGYLRAFLRALRGATVGPLTAAAREADPKFQYRWGMQDEPVRRVLEERPMHLLPAEFPDWRARIRAAAREAIEDLAERATERGMAGRGPAIAWGELNRANFQHPLARAVPALGRVLSAPRHPQPGSESSVRVAGPGFGASQRMVVSPGRPERAIFHMPGGQSGHPLSPHYMDGHEAWREGRATPLLPGASASVFRLVPATVGAGGR